MNRISPAPALKVRTMAQLDTDLTAEGSPPPGAVETSIQLKSTPPDRSGVSGDAKHGRTRTPATVPKNAAPKLPHERDESINTTGTIPSEPMKQADRDLKRGLKDTDRGPEAGRTYKKLR